MSLRHSVSLAALVLFGVPFAVVLLLFIFIGGRMDGDGQNYYIYLRSAVFDGDLDLRNDYEMFPRDDPLVAQICIDSKGYAPNVFSVGPAVLWSPFFLAARLISLAMPPDYVGNVNQGKGEPYYTAICLASIIASFIGIIAAYRFTAKRTGPAPALLGTLAIWLASSAIHYQIFEPFMSHALSMFAVSVFIAKAAAIERFRRRSDWALLGALAGMMSLVRWQNVIFAVIPAILLLNAHIFPTRRDQRPKLPLAGILVAIIAALIAFLPQIITWRIIYGRFFLIPQSGGFIDLRHPHIWQVLFSTRGGLFLWTPVLLLATIGLVRASLARDRLAIAMLPVFLLQLYLNASIMDWWGGEAFGARRFIGLFPVFVYGFAWLVAPRQEWTATSAKAPRKALFRSACAITVILILSNSILLTRYAEGDIPRGRAMSLSDLVSGQLTTARNWLSWLAKLPNAIKVSYSLTLPVSTAYSALDMPPHGSAPNLLLNIGSNDEGAVLGEGWYQKERWGAIPFRWGSTLTETVFRSSHSAPGFIEITAHAATSAKRLAFRASLNDASLGSFTVGDGWEDIMLPYPNRALCQGFNVLRIECQSHPPRPMPPRGFIIPHTTAWCRANLSLASKDCGDGLTSEILINEHQTSPNRFGINIVAFDPARPQSFATATLKFGASAQEQEALAKRINGAPESTVFAVSSRTFGVLKTDRKWLRRTLLLLTRSRRNYFANSGIGKLRILRKDTAGRPQWVSDAPVSGLEQISRLEGVLAKLPFKTIYVVALGEHETPLQPELVEAFGHIGIDITLPYQSRAPFVAIGGKFMRGQAAIAEVAERGTASLRFGQFADPRDLCLAVDRIALTALSSLGQ